MACILQMFQVFVYYVLFCVPFMFTSQVFEIITLMEHVFFGSSLIVILFSLFTAHDSNTQAMLVDNTILDSTDSKGK